jgi:putative membrane protein
MFKSIILSIAVNGLSLYATDQLTDIFSIEGGYKTILIAGLILGILNGILKPLLGLLTFPLKYMTLGLSTIVINIFIFVLADGLMEALFGLKYDLIIEKSLASYLIIGILFGTINWLMNLIKK